MTHEEKWELTDKLLAAMPASLTDFYAAVREAWPKLWRSLYQHNTPVDAAAGILHNLRTTPYIDGVAPTPEGLIAYFEARSRE